jgi:hypothetical protein
MSKQNMSKPNESKLNVFKRSVSIQSIFKLRAIAIHQSSFEVEYV